MSWVTPVTDRTSTSKGNISDLNRIEGNTDAVLDLFETFTTRPTTDTIKTDWANTDWPYDDELNRIEDNIEDIKEQTATPIGWQTPKTDWVTGNCPDYEDLNRIESNLLSLYIMANGIILEFKYCGTFYCGEDVVF